MDSTMVWAFILGISVGLIIGRIAGKKEANQTWEAWKHHQEWLAQEKDH